MNTQDNFSELETVFGLKILEFLDADPGAGIFSLCDSGSGIRDGQKFGSRIRYKHPGSATLAFR
jgi:hypothetical protein